MRIGTRSLLFGVHQFLWHPITVGLAWRRCYGRWPRWHQWVSIFCHDLGYWGKPNMDGDEGRTHPERGAELAYRIVNRIGGLFAYDIATRIQANSRALDAYSLALHHSTHYAEHVGREVSALYLPDKVSVLFEPRWFYLLRARLTGELAEYLSNSPFAAAAAVEQLGIECGEIPGKPIVPTIWFEWYRGKIKKKFVLSLGERAEAVKSCIGV